MIDISGMRFGRLVAIDLHHTRKNKRYWTCVCDCGEETIVRQDQLTTSKTMSCGCYMKEIRLTNLKKQQVKKTKLQEINRVDGHNRNWNP